MQIVRRKYCYRGVALTGARRPPATQSKVDCSARSLSTLPRKLDPNACEQRLEPVRKNPTGGCSSRDFDACRSGTSPPNSRRNQ